ncbi:MAG: ethanolamine ammonia-lyase subunit EutC [Deltaproteobacteria bacterium]|nr:ethanolamine ammonia-lyase subunit EutC [Deltaproteobacteria bacterium]
MKLDRDALVRLVREVVKETLTVPAMGPVSAPAEPCEDGCAPRNAPRQVPIDPHEARRVVDATPARVVQGRTGTRYLTPAYLQLRAEHAIALDAVHSSVPPEWPAKVGLVALRSRCKDLAEHLLHPDHGRRLDDESRAQLERTADRGVDVQLIAGDGLSARALLLQGAELVPALCRELAQVGLRVGKPLFVRHARIGVADEIGALTGARSTLIIVGERPGLGTGDSLSIYTAFKPRLGQDNAEKNCISNIRPLGLPPAAAARECALLLRRTFDAGGGGLHLVRPRRDVVGHGG